MTVPLPLSDVTEDTKLPPSPTLLKTVSPPNPPILMFLETLEKLLLVLITLVLLFTKMEDLLLFLPEITKMPS